MARRHGRKGRLYVAISSGGTPEPIAYLNTWNIDFTTDKVDVTAFEDDNKVKSGGLADVGIGFGGFWDSATAQLETAALDGVERGFYLYPDRSNDAGRYWYGEALFDFSVSGRVDGAVEISGSAEAAGNVTSVGL